MNLRRLTLLSPIKESRHLFKCSGFSIEATEFKDNGLTPQAPRGSQSMHSPTRQLSSQFGSFFSVAKKNPRVQPN